MLPRLSRFAWQLLMALYFIFTGNNGRASSLDAAAASALCSLGAGLFSKERRYESIAD